FDACDDRCEDAPTQGKQPERQHESHMAPDSYARALFDARSTTYKPQRNRLTTSVDMEAKSGPVQSGEAKASRPRKAATTGEFERRSSASHPAARWRHRRAQT